MFKISTCSIKRINFAKNLITDTGGSLLGQSISQNRTLEELTLSWNNLKNGSGHEFVESLKVNKVLKKLKLDNNLVGLSFIDQIEEYISRNNLSY